jgi:hypothetical protein
MRLRDAAALASPWPRKGAAAARLLEGRVIVYAKVQGQPVRPYAVHRRCGVLEVAPDVKLIRGGGGSGSRHPRPPDDQSPADGETRLPCAGPIRSATA